MDIKKKLIKYLANYIEQEMTSFIQAFDNGTGDVATEIDDSLLADWIIQGIEAFESIEDVDMDFFPKIHHSV